MSKTRSAGAPAPPDSKALESARRLLADVDRVADPFQTAELFPGPVYWDEDFWRFERSALFEREWLCVGHVNQLAKAGDHFTITLIDEPLIVSRDAKGEINVVSAICQHRGHPLMDGLATPAKPGVKNAKLLVCPYHAWSYQLDGSLVAAPGMEKTASLEELRCRIRLPRLRHEIFHGLIFVNFNSDAQPLAATMAKVDAALANFDLANLVPTPTASTGVIRSNWKIYQENSLEPYHTDVVHKNSHNPAPAHLSKFYNFEPNDGGVITTTGFSGGSELFTADGQLELPQIAGLTSEEKNQILFISVMPVLFLLCEAGSVLITLALPRGADTMELVTFSLYPRAAVESPGFEDSVKKQATALLTIVNEDLTTQEALQRGHRSRFTPKGVLSWMEGTLPQMNHWLLVRYRAALARAAGDGV